MFQARCQLRQDRTNQVRTITWDRGRLRGDPVAIAVIEDEAAVREGQTVGPPEGPTTTSNHLASDLSTLFLLREISIAEPTFSGEIPTRPPIPAGAIGD